MIATAPSVPFEAPTRSFDHLSFSAISLYQQCPLRFAFRYLLGMPEEVVSASLVFGSAIHASLEFHFQELLAGQPAPSLDTLLDVFQESWRLREGPDIRFGKNESLSTLGRLAERMLRAFQTSELAQGRGTILGIEEELRAELVPGCPPLLGRLDLVVETGAAVTVTDFKTARSQWSTEQVLEASSQLLLYSELAKPLAGGKPLRLAFAVLTKTQTPALHLHPVTVDPVQVERAKRIVERVWRAIRTGHIYPSPSPMNCPGCPYRRACRSWAG